MSSSKDPCYLCTSRTPVELATKVLTIVRCYVIKSIVQYWFQVVKNLFTNISLYISEKRVSPIGNLIYFLEGRGFRFFSAKLSQRPVREVGIYNNEGGTTGKKIFNLLLYSEENEGGIISSKSFKFNKKYLYFRLGLLTSKYKIVELRTSGEGDNTHPPNPAIQISILCKYFYNNYIRKYARFLTELKIIRGDYSLKFDG
ncbi:hypothetical protein B0T13DRAFT_452176 [Neurospora crassa]|nr:hypothetical protein B0T13DRAFT_452176 [Neurospora crassa]